MKVETIIALIGSACAVSGVVFHMVTSAYKYGRVVQRVEHLEEDNKRKEQLQDKIFSALEVIKTDIASIMAVLPKRRNDRS